MHCPAWDDAYLLPVASVMGHGYNKKTYYTPKADYTRKKKIFVVLHGP